jgi:uncharacterized DUF497 family protein
MNYTWNENKLALNLKNHKVHFATAQHFEWESATIEPDIRKDYGESRFCAYGLIETRLHCLVFTPRNDSIRIISLRKANKREVNRYVLEN